MRRIAPDGKGGRPLTSVVVPVFNAELRVEEAVRSALDLPRDLEVILIEDGSTDGSLAVCRTLAAGSGRVRLLRCPGGRNRGAGASRNAGIRAARGRYVAFLDADDYYLPNRFEHDVALMERDATVEGVYGAVRIESETGPAGARRAEVISVARPVDPAVLFETLLAGGVGQFHTNGITVRREVFGKTGPFDQSLVLAQDTAMWLKMAACCTLAGGSLREPVAVYRHHGGSRATPRNPLWRDAVCACLASALRWALRVRLREDRIVLLRRRLVRQMLFGRRLWGLSFPAKVLRVCRRTAAYGITDPFLVPELLRMAGRKLGGQPTCRAPVSKVGEGRGV